MAQKRYGEVDMYLLGVGWTMHPSLSLTFLGIPSMKLVFVFYREDVFRLNSQRS